MTLTTKQRRSLWADDGEPIIGLRIVSALPGTGKSSTLSQYCIDLHLRWPRLCRPWQGIAMLSYTNVAKDELADKIQRQGTAHNFLRSPHFAGTLDAFVNQYIFLPFGTSVMHCAGRPRLVGEPFGTWHANGRLVKGTNDRFSSLFFDCYSLTAGGYPYVADPNVRKVDDTKVRPAALVTPDNAPKIINMKRAIWRQGEATQNDANYLALEALRASPALTRSLIKRFPAFIVDEAQDLTEIQHGLLDHLVASGHQHVVLVGDQHQAIYEWNTARPQLFIAKMQTPPWKSSTLADSFRCSPAICAALSKLGEESLTITAAAEGKNIHYPAIVDVATYAKDTIADDLTKAIDHLAKHLGASSSHQGDMTTIAVLTRSTSDAPYLQAAYAGVAAQAAKPALWEPGVLTKDFLRVIHHLMRADIAAAFSAYEALLLKTKPELVSRSELRKAISRAAQTDGANLAAYRIAVMSDVLALRDRLPPDLQTPMTISDCAGLTDVSLRWINATRRRDIGAELTSFGVGGEKESQNRPIAAIFTSTAERSYLPIPGHENMRVLFSTVHGVKGETYDGVIFSVKRTTKACGCPASSTAWKSIFGHPLVECETKRIIYVALSRAARALTVFTPPTTARVWQGLLS